jgi:hypothetical protein
MINSVMSFPCDECKSIGYIFWGDELDYDVEQCECQDFSLGILFNSKEAN